MVNLNTYSICGFLMLGIVVGCGNTPIKPANTIEIFNGNSVNQIDREFKLTKLKDRASFEQLPKELASYQTQIDQFDFYLAQSPTQNSGLYSFTITNSSVPIKICLKRPESVSISLGVVTNPVALVKVKKGLIVEMNLGYCIR